MDIAGTDKTQELIITPIKRARGGRRPGAGRKPNPFKRLQVKPPTAAEILARYPEDEAWGYLLEHEDPNVRLKARIFLTEKRDGKARQAVDVSGGILHVNAIYRNERLAALSPEELTALIPIARKLETPAPPIAESPLEAQIVEEGTAE